MKHTTTRRCAVCGDGVDGYCEFCPVQPRVVIDNIYNIQGTVVLTFADGSETVIG